MPNLDAIYRVIHQPSGHVVHDFDREDSASQCAEDENEEYPDSHVVVKYVRADLAQPPAALAVLPEPLPPTPDTMNLTDAQREVEDAFRRGWNSCRATLMQAQQPAALAVPAYYPLGETIYTPPSEEVRFCYSRGQPNNINASRLGEACRRAAERPGGDYIDGGLSLLKELEARGYGVFRFAKSAHEQAHQPAAAVPEGYALVPVHSLRWWRELAEINPQDLVPRIDAMLAAAERAQGVE